MRGRSSHLPASRKLQTAVFWSLCEQTTVFLAGLTATRVAAMVRPDKEVKGSMSIVEGETLGLLFLWLVAAVLAFHIVRRPPRCGRCHAPAEIDDTAEDERASPVLMLNYRCSHCGQVVHRRFLGAWD